MPVKKSLPLKEGKKVANKKIVKKVVAAKVEAAKVSKPATTRTPRVSGLSVPVYSLAGRATGTMALPKEIFGSVVNKKLLSQAMRVYFANQNSHPGSTKTRGEVRGSTAKIYRQKGTGRARHGSIRAPIFVGGGIVFGPTPRDAKLILPQKMRKQALISALSSKLKDEEILGVSGLEKATGKTKEIAKLMSSIYNQQSKEKKQKKISALLVTAEQMDNVVHGVKNIPGVSVLPSNQLNAYEVLKHKMLFISKEAVEKLSGVLLSGGKH